MAASARTTTPKRSPRQATAYPGDDEIRLRAYQFFVERNGAPGDPLADWLRAERELAAERSANEARPNGRSRKASPTRG